MGKRGFSRLKHDFNTEFDKLLFDHDHNELHSVCDYTVVRPPYSYTSQCPNEHWRDPAPPGRLKAKLRDKKT